MTPQNTFGSDPSVDESVWTTALVRIGGFLKSISNEFMHCIQCFSQPSHSTASYEKCGQMIQGIQQDPSDYGNSITRDLVAASRVGEISGTQTGRVWGGYDECGVLSGSDGLALARETGGNNNGSEQPDLDTPTTKVLESMVAGEYPGNKKMTAARLVVGGTSQFFMGDVFERSAFASDASPAVGIRDGNQIIAGLRADGTLQMRFFVQADRPTMQPGTFALWADSHGTLQLIFFDGANFFRTVLTLL